ncbi:MAG: hypothetical protein AB1752_05425 [Candidatus Zixiibacteriota bacterium]
MTISRVISCGLALLALSCGAGQEADKPAADARPPGCIILSYASDNADTVSIVPADSVTVLDWLRFACDSARLPLEVQSYPFGDLVIQIADRKNGEGGFWLYKVNSQPVPEAASLHRVSPSDTVMFFYK